MKLPCCCLVVRGMVSLWLPKELGMSESVLGLQLSPGPSSRCPLIAYCLTMECRGFQVGGGVHVVLLLIHDT